MEWTRDRDFVWIDTTLYQCQFKAPFCSNAFVMQLLVKKKTHFLKVPEFCISYLIRKNRFGTFEIEKILDLGNPCAPIIIFASWERRSRSSNIWKWQLIFQNHFFQNNLFWHFNFPFSNTFLTARFFKRQHYASSIDFHVPINNVVHTFSRTGPLVSTI